MPLDAQWFVDSHRDLTNLRSSCAELSQWTLDHYRAASSALRIEAGVGWSAFKASGSFRNAVIVDREVS
jgi:hypothetical protein